MGVNKRSNTGKESLEVIEHEIAMLLRRADFKRTLDGKKDSLDRSGYILLDGLMQNGPASFRALSLLLQLDISTVSRQVAPLENKGFVIRGKDEKDARISTLSITESGKDALLAAKHDRKEAYQEILFEWTSEEKDIFAELLTRLNRKIADRKKLEQN
ncbi:MarR family winged helix-turn-helix transcriptional regulator [Actinomycetes bacterium NPDC127524]